MLREGRRQSLLDSAKKEFAANGYSGASVSDIVKRTGIARATFYHYFDDKLDVFETILDSFLEDPGRCIKPISMEIGASSPLTQIRDNLTRVFEFVLGQGDLTQILMQHANTVDSSVNQRLNAFNKNAASMIERSLNVGIGMGLIRSCDTKLTAYAIIGAVKEWSSRSPRPRAPGRELRA